MNENRDCVLHAGFGAVLVCIMRPVRRMDGKQHMCVCELPAEPTAVCWWMH